MSRSRETARVIAKMSGNLAVTSLDLTVLLAGLAGGILLTGYGAHPSRPDSWKVPFYVSAWAYRLWDKTKFRRALGRAVGEGLLMEIEKGYRLTTIGRRRFQELLPTYKRRTSWDGRLWLITYDISEKRKKQRELFRELLERVGCAMVQESVWLSIKDPRPWLTGEISSRGLKAQVIISCLGKDGSLGEEDIRQLINRVFNLTKLNRRYSSWLKRTMHTEDNELFHQGLHFLGIIRDDPMLPAELLPTDWAGERALELFEKKVQPKIGLIREFINF